MIVLAATLHDPHAGLLWRMKKCLTLVQALFDKVVVVVTPATHPDVLAYLKDAQCIVERRKKNVVGETYFRAFELGAQQEPGYIFACDFDRILHWVDRYPSELHQVVKKLQRSEKGRAEYIVCERTPRAYRTHHEALYTCEQIANRLVSNALGEKKQHDFLSGACIASQAAAKILLAYGGPYPGIEHMAVWPLVLQKKKVHVSYQAFEGLEWETPHQYREQVRRAGGVREWRKQLSTLTEWKRRVGHIQQMIDGIEVANGA